MNIQPSICAHREASQKNTDDFGEAFIQRLQTEALESLAVKHPYLQAIANGDFANMESALKDFACQYGHYTARFTQYVSAVISNACHEAHKAILTENLEEELGNAHDVDLPPEILATIADEPHTRLFKRFQKAIGVDERYSRQTPSCDAGSDWAKQFLQLCGTNQYVGIGAIGIGTEFIVSAIYRQILQGITEYTSLQPEQHVFFDLHSECDDEHAEQITRITTDLLNEPGAAEQIEYGARQALALRTAFWDAMLERSQQVSHPEKQLVV
ncbi:iron-containing redox enzyme family protein [Porticoccus sp. W117]|uniref:TenA family transcriptional regulator n=1 Tax=Porticoccus sp. W117 TaxID=3054777 RepID=UPI0025924B9C|nr:iron-containing redox enzyme family protein [Porticoccus sp. W117]MDM3870199.1 iron-containing redox enzyme family protein [Porticoccus sp. W117]